MFKTKPIYIKIKRNFIEITDLETGQTVSMQAIRPFSSARNIVSSFQHANETISAILREFGIKTTGIFRRGVQVLIQQLEGLEEGLSDIEKRALRDLGEMAGASKVVLLENDRPFSVDLALDHLRTNKN